MTTVEDRDVRRARQLADAFIAFLETGEVRPGLFAPDLLCDFSLPTWRLQSVGPEQARALRLAGHEGPSTVVRHRLDPLGGAGQGFVLEVEERWHDAGQDWYCRELFRADVGENGITTLAVYCTGDWDEARVAQHAREISLVRP
jgi:hypothetical protein